MTVQYKITDLERTIPDGTVVAAHWFATLQDGQYTASTYGVVALERNEASADFIPFEDLTEEVVVKWVKENIDVEAIESEMQDQITQQKMPKQVSGLPWTNAAPVPFVE